jgi:hypothetical protein
MQNREDLRQKGHNRSRIITYCGSEKKYIFGEGGGENKYRFWIKIQIPGVCFGSFNKKVPVNVFFCDF